MMICSVPFFGIRRLFLSQLDSTPPQETLRPSHVERDRSAILREQFWLPNELMVKGCRDSPQRQYGRQTAVGTHPRNATRGRLLSLPLSYRSWSGGGRKRASQLGDSDNG